METEIKHVLTTDQAVKLFKSAPTKSRFCCHVRFDAAVDGKPDHVYADACSSYVKLSRSAAVKFVSGLLTPNMVEKGARIRISEFDRGPAETVFWIGG